MSKLKELIKQQGLSFTIARERILKVLMLEHGPFTAEEIFQRLPKKTCDQATLFRTLKQFREKGLITATYLIDKITRYEFHDPHHHHHHVSCRICGKIETIHKCSLEAIEKNVLEMGYIKLTHSLEFEGICKKCRPK
ncbi:MAG: transcriptional repressor [Halobacteriovoraceae bacterium]|nr:transcriptional repressor [Halobacteriovoraceae bacterium]